MSEQQKGVLVVVAWEDPVSDHGAATALNVESLETRFGSPFPLLLLCLPDVKKNPIMTQDQINCLHNTKEI